MNENNNDFMPVTQEVSAVTQVEQSRAVAEVQGMIISAKKFPRDELASILRIQKACERYRLADMAMYTYPRGGENVTGPSIRLLETVAQAWGNLDFGVRELERGDKESEMEAYCWDMETNTRRTKRFTVPHIRSRKAGNKRLTDPRDIYETTANMGARRERACIQGIVPGDVIDIAVEACRATLAKGDGTPLEDRIRAMVSKFAELSITMELLEKRLEHKLDLTTGEEIVELITVYNAIKDNIGKRSAYFDIKDGVSEGAKNANKKYGKEPSLTDDENTELLVLCNDDAGKLKQYLAENNHDYAATKAALEAGA